MSLDFSMETIYSACTRLSIPKGGRIVDASKKDAYDFTYFLHSGICALSNITEEGKHKIYLYFTRPQPIGFSHIGIPHFRYSPFFGPIPVFITAKTDCILYRMKTSYFQRLMDENHRFCSYMFDSLMHNYLTLFQHMAENNGTSAPIRLCSFLLEYSSLQDGVLTLPSLFTYEEIGDYLDIHPVTAARIIRRLKDNGIVSRKGRSLHICSPELLEQILLKQSWFSYS